MNSIVETPKVNQLYQDTLDYLYTFVDFSLTRNFQYSPEKFNLARMEELLRLLGNPHQAYPVIHVAGTKGKGSTAAMIANVLRSSGLRVGFYTSPHLQEFTERIQIDGQEIARHDFVAMVDNELRPRLAQLDQPPTFFELTTAMAFLYFANHHCDVGVIEVGLGGRLDSTNVVTPLVSVITSLSMDHMAVLGDTLEKIAAEKAGIIKPGRPVVCAPQREEAGRVVAQLAAERGSRLIQVGRDYQFAAGSHSLDNQHFSVWAKDQQGDGADPTESSAVPAGAAQYGLPLLGFHQVQNAAVAYAALQVAREEGLQLRDEAFAAGFETVVWPGRFEILQRSPLLVVDSAHNRDSAMRLRLTLDDYLPGRRVILLFGASEDKDISGMMEELLPRVSWFIATQSIHPRAADPAHLVKLAAPFDCSAQIALPVETALERALELAEQEQAVVVAAGSLFIAAAVRTAWQDKMGHTRPLGN